MANAQHENPKIREAAAASPVLPVTIQLNLVEDRDYGVRTWLAQNVYADPSVLAALANDRDYRVRAHAVWNPSTPVGIVEMAAEDDENLTVRRMAQMVLDSNIERVLQ